MPPPDTYTIKTSFDGPSPVIKKNTLTTSFKNQSGRDQYGKVFVPGYNQKSTCVEKNYPGPAAYTYDNQSMGTEGLSYTLAPRVKNIRGKL